MDYTQALRLAKRQGVRLGPPRKPEPKLKKHTQSTKRR